MGQKPRDEMLDHEFDGIREFDNPPPAWLMNILWASIVFSAGYWLYYHTLGVGKLPKDRLDQANAQAAELQLKKMAGKPITDQSLLLMSQVPDQVTAGRAIFEQLCVQCHGPRGEGIVGPNLTDVYWLHGGRPTQIHNTIVKGVPEKGMVAWMDQLGPDRVNKVAAYVLTIKNTNVPGKAPQGNPETADAAPTSNGASTVPAGATTPGGATPGGTGPGGTGPGGTGPAGAPPSGTAPGSSAPTETAPATTPAGSAPPGAAPGTGAQGTGAKEGNDPTLHAGNR